MGVGCNLAPSMRKPLVVLAVCTTFTSGLQATSHRPSIHLLSSSVVAACAPLCADGEWVEPEEAAWAAAQVINTIDLPAPEEASDPQQIVPQGEFKFDVDAPFSSRRVRCDCHASIGWIQHSSFAHPAAQELCEEAAYAGDALAQHTMGLLHYSGIGGAERDARLSACWHAAAAAQGNVEALAVLGGCVRRGVGVEQDAQMGIQLIEAAAAAGSPCGLVKLGALHEEGEYGDQPADQYLAARHFSRAASQGSALGLFNYGWSLVYGIGVQRDIKRGFAAWKAAVESAPDDGAEEAAFKMYEERDLLTSRQQRIIQPDRCLRLAASLEYEPAVEALAAREAAGNEAALRRILGTQGKKDRFIRNDKARAWTMAEERGEALLDR